jgi:hypothetical protein
LIVLVGLTVAVIIYPIKTSVAVISAPGDVLPTFKGTFLTYCVSTLTIIVETITTYFNRVRVNLVNIVTAIITLTGCPGLQVIVAVCVTTATIKDGDIT